MIVFKSTAFFATLWLLLQLQNQGVATTAVTRRFELNITKAMVNPDCYNQSYSYPVVNGQFPGPTIRVIQGDYVEVLVRNQMVDASTSIHFHGIRQYGTVESDGVPYLTQAPIAPGETFLHRFQVINQSGTYFYHAHIGMQDDSVHGAFIVHEDERSIPCVQQKAHQRDNVNLSRRPPYSEQQQQLALQDGPYIYHDERTVQLSEWWHTPLKEREEYFMGPSYVFDPGSASILMNGRTVFASSNTTAGIIPQNNDTKCPGFTTLQVERNKTYRFRIIGANTFRTLGFSIANHILTIIEVDGELVKPVQTDLLEVAAGQRFSVLVTTSGKNSSYVMATSYRFRNRASGYTENGYSYLKYVDDNDQNQCTGAPQRQTYTRDLVRKDLLTPIPADSEKTDWIWPQLSSLKPHDKYVLNAPADRTIKLRIQTLKNADNTTRYYVNGRPPVNWESQGVVLHDVLQQQQYHHHDFHSYVISSRRDYQQLTEEADHAASYNEKHQTYPIKYGEIVDLVFQNTLRTPTECLTHPWHTHGHSHYLLATGPGEYVHEKLGNIRNMPQPVYKDVSMAYPAIPQDPSLGGEDGLGCGWAKVRILAVSSSSNRI